MYSEIAMRKETSIHEFYNDNVILLYARGVRKTFSNEFLYHKCILASVKRFFRTSRGNVLFPLQFEVRQYETDSILPRKN